MAAPALRIPIGGDLSQFEKATRDAQSHVASATKQIAQQFANLNERAIQPAIQGAAAFGTAWNSVSLRTIARFAGIATAGVIAFKLIAGAVDSARERIGDMVEIADRAGKLNVSPEFLQSVDKLAKGSKEFKDSLESSLQFFNEATKDKLNLSISPDEPEAVKRAMTDVETAIRGIVEILPSANFGLDQFLAGSNSNNVEQKMRAVLQIMIDLLQTGQRIEAINLAEKAFGPQMANNLRNGKVTADDLQRTIDRIAKDTPGMISNEAAKRAKDLDDRLQDAWRTIDNNLKPSWDDLANIVLKIKGIWVEIVELGAKASSLVPAAADRASVERRRVGAIVADAGTGATGLNPQIARQRERILANRGQESRGDIFAEFGQIPSAADVGQAANVPLPRRRPLDIPQTKEKEGAERDDFDRQVESIERHIAAMKADALAVGQTEGQHAKLRAELGLLQALQREGSEVTTAQIDKYTELRASMSAEQALAGAGINLNEAHAASFAKVTTRIGEAATASVRAKDGWENLNNAVQFSGQQLVDIFDQLGSKTQSFGDVVKSVFQSVKRAFLEAALYGGGPLAGILGTKSNVAGGTGGLLGALFGGFRASGGPVEPGRAYMINENTPNSEFFIPSAPGTVVPNAVMTRAAGGASGPNVNISYVNHFDAGIGPADMALISAQIRTSEQRTRNDVTNIVRGTLRNDRDALQR